MGRLARWAEWLLIAGVAAALAGMVLRLRSGLDAFSTLDAADVLLALSVGALAVAALRIHIMIREARTIEATSRRLLEIACDAVLVITPTRQIAQVSPRAAALFGYAPAELIGQPINHVLSDWSPSPADWPTAVQGRSPGETVTEFAGLARDGTTLTLEIGTGPVAGTVPGGMALLIRDVTRGRRVRDELRAKEAHLRMVVEQMPAILWTTNSQLHITATVGAGLAALDLKPADLIGMSMLETLGRPDLESTPVSAHVRALRGESLSHEMEWHGHTFQVRVEPLRNPERRIAGTIGVVLDVTDRKEAKATQDRLEEQLRQAQKMEAVGRLAGGIAHDFNNLLCIITGYAELALTQVPGQAPLHAFLSEINKAGNRAATLTRQLLAFSRKSLLAPKVLDLNALIRDAGTMLRRVIGEDIELTTALEAHLPTVKADPNQIEQVLMNLVVNARDAMAEGGRLEIRTARTTVTETDVRDQPEIRPGVYVTFAVSDTGCGMDEATRARIFEPFFTTKEVGKGTGLGLAMAYGIVKQSGGHITVKTAPGQGAVFRIYLPCADSLRAELAPVGPSAEIPPGNETVLLAEDEAGVRALVLEVLQRSGYTVLEARDGEEALALSAQHDGPIHLLLTDVVMPRLSGGRLARCLGRERPETRVLFMSGFADSTLLRHGAVAGDVDCLVKPFTPEDLTRKVRETLDDVPAL
jgi:PAS domain S-box-containing protein